MYKSTLIHPVTYFVFSVRNAKINVARRSFGKSKEDTQGSNSSSSFITVFMYRGTQCIIYCMFPIYQYFMHTSTV